MTESWPIELDGTVFTPVPDSPHHWTYRPTAVTLALGPNGRAQLSVIEVATFAMISLTTQLAPATPALERARDVLAEHDRVARGQIVLTAESLEVDAVSLLISDGEAELKPLASTTSSGATPYSAVFSVTLDPGQLAAVMKSLAGEPGWLVATYAVRLIPARPPVINNETSTQSCSSTVTTTTVTTSGSITTTVHQDDDSTPPVTRPEETGEPTSSPPPDLAPQVAMITTDAATWASSL